MQRGENSDPPPSSHAEKAEKKVHSIMQMVEKMVSDHHIDRTLGWRSYDVAMLASYPEAFAAGAVIATIGILSVCCLKSNGRQ